VGGACPGYEHVLEMSMLLHGSCLLCSIVDYEL
jgi:hypothetical protein